MTARILITFVFVAIGLGVVTDVNAQTHITRLVRPKVVNGDLLLPQTEAIRNTTDDMVEFIGQGGADNTDLRIDLDGTAPEISSPTDTAIVIAETLTVSSGGTGDAQVDLPENSIGPDEMAGVHDSIWTCGQLANNGTVFSGPVVQFLAGDYTTSFVMGGAGCDALENADEATADTPVGWANTAFKVTGMVCEVSSSGANGVVLTARSAVANLTPSITCTVPTGQTTCSTTTGSTTDIAANATIAVRATDTENLSAEDYSCKIGIIWK